MSQGGFSDSTEEIRNLGIDPDNPSDITDKVKFDAEEVGNARLAAEDPVALRVTAKKKKLKTEIEEKRNLLGKKKAAWSEQRSQEIFRITHGIYKKKSKTQKTCSTQNPVVTMGRRSGKCLSDKLLVSLKAIV